MKNVADIYALTPLQQRMLSQAVSAAGGDSLVEQFHCILRGEVDAQSLRAAAESLIERFALWRASFAWEGLKQPVHVIRRQVELPWQELDWREQPAANLPMLKTEFLAEDRRRGFDLRRAPLVRMHLVRTADDAWLFVLTCHHLIMDGWSLAIATGELFRRYQLARQGAVITNEPAHDFADYLKWLSSRDPSEADRFWKAYLGGVIAPSRLPIERQGRDRLRDQAGHGHCECRLSPAETAQLGETAARQRVGMSTFVNAAWAILLARYMATTDIVFGVTVSGRSAEVPDIETIVGPLLNNIPLRIIIDWTAAVSQLLRHVQDAQTSIQQYEYDPLERVIEVAGLPAGGRPFDTLVIFENYPWADTRRVQAGGLEIDEIEGTTTSKYGLSLVAFPGQQVALRIMFDRQRFAEESVRRLLNQTKSLLTAMAADPEAIAGDLKLLDAASKAELHALSSRDAAECVLDVAGQEAPIGMPGEIWTIRTDREARRGIGSLAGYRPTGYYGVIQSDGRIECLGPKGARVVVANYRFDPEEVNAIVRLHPLVEQAVVVARPDLQGETILAAYVVASADAATAANPSEPGLLFDQLRRFVAERLPEAMVPRVWRGLKSLPVTDSGEVDIDRLPPANRPRDDAWPTYAPPRDVLEARLCNLWSELLGVEPVGVRDSFLDLGGHSTLAVALAARIEEEFGRRLPLASFYSQPSVEQMARLIRREEMPQSQSLVVPLRQRGALPPVFCVHPAGGTVFCYLELARHLKHDVPLYGLQAQGIDGGAPPHESVQDMAEAYLHAMKTVQPDGPYHVCGWSTGGVIAFELARQLAASGEMVPLLVLLDAAIPRSGESFGEEDLIALLSLLFPTDDPERLAMLRELNIEAQLAEFERRARRSQLLAEGSSSAQVQQIYGVFQANMEAVMKYQPKPYAGRMTIFRAKHHATPMHDDPFLGWGSWIMGGISVRELQCSHLEMFQPSGAIEVAGALDRCIAETLAGNARPGR